MHRALGSALAELRKAEQSAALVVGGKNTRRNLEAIREVREALERVIDAQH